MFRRTVGDRLVMSPMEPLVAGGAAEAFERHLQQLYRGGYRHLVVDLSGVPLIDSAGIRAFVRSHTTAQRAGGTLELSGVGDAAEAVIGGGRKAGAIPIRPFQPFIELLKPIVAALIGLLMTAIHQPASRERGRSIEQVQTLLSLEDLSVELMLEGGGVKSVAWEHTQRERA
jgi:anti-anti-sigma factor